MNEETQNARRLKLQAIWSLVSLAFILPIAYYVGYYWESYVEYPYIKNISSTKGGRPDASVVSTPPAHTLLRSTEAGETSSEVLLEAQRAEEVSAETNRALRRARLVKLLAFANKTQNEVTEVITQARSLEELENQIESGDAGKRISADGALVSSYAAISKLPVPNLVDATEWQRQCLTAAAPLRDASDEDQANFVVQPELQSFLSELYENAVKANEQIRNRRAELQLLVESSRSLKPSEVPLRTRVLKNEQDLIAKGMEIGAKTREEAIVDQARQHAEHLGQERTLTLAAINTVEVEKERLKRMAADKELADLTRIQAVAESQQLAEKLQSEYQEDLPEIQQLLKPFLDTGDSTQPGAVNWDPGVQMFATDSYRPISYGSLSSCSALDDNDDSLRRLHYIGGCFYNRRKKGAFPTYSDHGTFDPSVKSKLERARELLLKYGDLLVQERKLRE